MTDKLMSFFHFSSRLNYPCLVFQSQVKEEYDPPPLNSENKCTQRVIPSEWQDYCFQTK